MWLGELHADNNYHTEQVVINYSFYLNARTTLQHKKTLVKYTSGTKTGI